MSCRTDYDCGYGNSCRSKAGGGTECRITTASKYPSKIIPPVSSGVICKTDLDCNKNEFCWSVNDSDKKECQARLPSNQADEQTAKNTAQKEITTNVIWEKDGIIYLPNEMKPFTGIHYRTLLKRHLKKYKQLIKI